MTRYLVLLRGINVGGRNKVPMAALRDLLESHGHTKVSDVHRQRQRDPELRPLSAAAIKRELEEALPKVFKLDSELIAVLVLTRAQLRAVVRKRPKGFGDHPETYHSDAVFLMGIDAPTALKVFDPRPGVDEVWPGTGVIYSQRLSAQRTKSRLGKIVGTPAYKSMTIRSWQTTMALLERMEAPRPTSAGTSARDHRCSQRVGDLARPGLDGVPVTEIAGREGLLDRRQQSHEPLRRHLGRVIGVERAEEDAVILRVRRGRDLGDLLPAAASRAILRTESVRQRVNA